MPKGTKKIVCVVEKDHTPWNTTGHSDKFSLALSQSVVSVVYPFTRSRYSPKTIVIDSSLEI